MSFMPENVSKFYLMRMAKYLLVSPSEAHASNDTEALRGE